MQDVCKSMSILKNSLLPIRASTDPHVSEEEQKEEFVNLDENIAVDEEFPPRASSLGKIFSINKIKKWARPASIYKNSQLNVFAQDLTANDVNEGILGDSYLITSMSTLASKPKLIHRLVCQESKKYENLYGVWLFDSGYWKKIVIDDHVPCTFDGPAFCRKGKNDNIWGFLLEKAYAKMYGSYQRIESGDPTEALNVLTGAPIKIFTKGEYSLKKKPQGYNLSEKDQIWEFIRINLNNSFLVTARISMSSSFDLVSNNYGILKVTVIGPRNQRIVKLRDPKGEHGLNPLLKEKSLKLIQSLQEITNIDEMSQMNGCFWIDFDSFYERFESVGICKAREGFENYHVQVAQSRKFSSSFVEVKVDQKGLIYFTVYQKNKKHFKDELNYKYSNIRVLVAEMKDDNTFRYVKGKTGIKQQITIHGDFAPGKYVIMIEADWNQEIHNELSVSVYTDLNIVLNSYNPTYKGIVDFYKRFIKAYIISEKIQPGQEFYDQFNEIKVKRDVLSYSIDKFGLWIQYYINNEKEAIFNLKLNYEKSESWETLYPSAGEDVQNFTLGPKCEEIVINKIEPIIPFQYGITLKYSLSRNSQTSWYFNYPLSIIMEYCIKYGRTKLWNGVDTYSLSYSQSAATFIRNKSSRLLHLWQRLDCKNMEVMTSRGPRTGELREDVVPGDTFFIRYIPKDPTLEHSLPSEPLHYEMTFITYSYCRA